MILKLLVLFQNVLALLNLIFIKLLLPFAHDIIFFLAAFSIHFFGTTHVTNFFLLRTLYAPAAIDICVLFIVLRRRLVAHFDLYLLFIQLYFIAFRRRTVFSWHYMHFNIKLTNTITECYVIASNYINEKQMLICFYLGSDYFGIYWGLVILIKESVPGVPTALFLILKSGRCARLHEIPKSVLAENFRLGRFGPPWGWLGALDLL